MGPLFWDHCVVLYTRWGQDPFQVKQREIQRLTEKSRTDEVIQMLNEECPNSRGKDIKVFFTDAFELT